MTRYAFDNHEHTLFTALKKSVDQYFADRNLSRTGNHKLYLKAMLLIGLAAGLYTLLVFFTPPAWIAIVLCIVLGLNMALIGFNIMHEGGHQSFSKHTWMNTVSAYFLNVLGGNSYYWKIKHNVNHHTYTNIEGLDSDIDVKPFMRLHEGQPLLPYHRFQHIYWVVLYSVSSIVWIFYEDFQKYVSGKVSVSSERKKIARKEHYIFWFTKAMYVLVYVVVPILMLGWLPWMIGFFIITLVCGLAISIVFQLAHVVEGTSFRSADTQDHTIKQEWAAHQLASTSNFATASNTLHWLLGGLNFQIEHHLFPRVSHIHYPAISVLVKEVCIKSGVAYNEYKTMAKAIISHISQLRRLGCQA